MTKFLTVFLVTLLWAAILSAGEDFGVMVGPNGEVIDSKKKEKKAEQENSEATEEVEKTTGKGSARKFGIGLILGEPTGLSARFDITKAHAIDALFSWSWYHYEQKRFLIHADYLFKYYGLVPIPKGDTALYFGAGARTGGFYWHNHDKVYAGDEYTGFFGLRVPAGILYQLNPAPIEFLFEVAFIVDLFPEVSPDFNIGIGIRFAF